MNLLIDTNILLWLLLNKQKLNEQQQKYLLEAESLSVSIVSFWEISIKKSGRGFDDLVLPKDWHTVFKQALVKHEIKIINISIEDCQLVQNLPYHHRDPFDRMIIAQAMENNLAVMTSDKLFSEYNVQVIS